MNFTFNTPVVQRIRVAGHIDEGRPEVLGAMTITRAFTLESRQVKRSVQSG